MPTEFVAPGRLFQVFRPGPKDANPGHREGVFKVGPWLAGECFTEEEFRRIHPCPDDMLPEVYYNGAKDPDGKIIVEGLFGRLLGNAKDIQAPPKMEDRADKDGNPYTVNVNAGLTVRAGVIRVVDPSEGLTASPPREGEPEGNPRPKYVPPLQLQMESMVKSMTAVLAQQNQEAQVAATEAIAAAVKKIMS